MRRPNVYQRSAPRARRVVEAQVGVDQGLAARAVLDVLPALLREAEAAGAVALSRYLGQAMSAAEGIVRRAAAVVDKFEVEATAEDDEGSGVRLRKVDP